MKNTAKASDILNRLGKNVQANQNHASGITADKKDPNAPLPDKTTQGGFGGNTHEKRTMDKSEGKEPIDTSKGAAGVNDSDDKQDYSKEYEGIYKGQGSVATSAVIGKKLKEGLELTVNLDDMRNLLESAEQDADFVTESLAIFEATMLETLNKQIDAMVVTATAIVESTIETEVLALESEIEEYLNVAVVEWAADNKLAIEESTTTNIAVGFMNDLARLMEAYNVVLPEESVDLYEEAIEAGNDLVEENEALQAQLAEATEELQSLNKVIYVESYIQDSNLTVSESERLRTVANELEFVSEDDFTNKLNTISEGYIKRSVKADTGNVQKQTINEDYMEGMDNEVETTTYVDPTVSMLAKNFTR